MWQVRCELGEGQVGKLVTRSWLLAAIQFVLWTMKGRPAVMQRYRGDPLRIRRMRAPVGRSDLHLVEGGRDRIVGADVRPFRKSERRKG
jgi:hypothetical protein